VQQSRLRHHKAEECKLQLQVTNFSRIVITQDAGFQGVPTGRGAGGEGSGNGVDAEETEGVAGIEDTDILN